MNIFFKKRTLSFLAFAVVFAVLFNKANASANFTESNMMKNLQNTGKEAYSTNAINQASLSSSISGIISVVLSMLGVIFIILFIYAGYNWMTAAGDEAKVEKARDTMWRAVIGLIIIVGAYSITYFVFKYLPWGNSQ